MDTNGKLNVTDPVTGKSGIIDPSTLPGYVGNFECRTASGKCNTYTMGTDTNGNFAYNFGTNPEVLSATKTPDNSNTSST